MMLDQPDTGCANFVLKEAANDGGAEFGADTANCVRNDFYVADELKSVSTADDTTCLLSNTKRLLGNAGLRLHKFL